MKPKTPDTKEKTKPPVASSNGLDVEGLHLWKIITNRHSTEGYYWITTKNRNAKTAIEKARRCARKKLGSLEISIRSLEYSGTLDA
jgi:hypothetical protein